MKSILTAIKRHPGRTILAVILAANVVGLARTLGFLSWEPTPPTPITVEMNVTVERQPAETYSPYPLIKSFEERVEERRAEYARFGRPEPTPTSDPLAIFDAPEDCKPSRIPGEPAEDCEDDLVQTMSDHATIAPRPETDITRNLDIDCEDVGGPVYVGFNDPDGLDRDGDGWGCEE